ncbi:DUF4435 domain-containing protein [Brevibacillus dissolubilis]|uniref:DUF4435 domain-containing protein n=1 Tax=Brevibacillus dissolubilis TaxID=1844116 RepID=UPI0011163BE5|nr:DUF4435 domain-containing protein [Brevibacillus dissolubilis]
MSRSIPRITIEAKNNLRFLEKVKPGIIFEGKTDYDIYGYLLAKSKHGKRCGKDVDLVIGESKNNILKYHKGGITFPYIAIIDSDYDKYLYNCIEDERIIYTHYYNIENYLTLEEVLDDFLDGVKIVGDPSVTGRSMLQEALNSIQPFIIACFIKMVNSHSYKLEDVSIENEQWWNSKEGCIDSDNMKKYLAVAMDGLDNKLIDEQFEFASDKINSLETVDYILNGKRKLEAVFFCMHKYFPNYMKGRNKKVFVGDLRRSLLCSPIVSEFVDIIDQKISELLSR